MDRMKSMLITVGIILVYSVAVALIYKLYKKFFAKRKSR
ncbi:putative membrane protein [Clostridium botulinum 202F]|nr:putative membrane protein [Clostridium botulinum 202F]